MGTEGNTEEEHSASNRVSRGRIDRKAEGETESESEEREGVHRLDRHTGGGRVHRSVGTAVASAASGGTGIPPTPGTVTYDPGPDVQRLSEDYGIDFCRDGQAEKVQRLEKELGSHKVQRWADEGMTVDTMGKPRDMEAFRKRKANRSEEIPDDIERQNQASVQRNVYREADEGPAGDSGAPNAVRNVISKPGKSLDGDVQREMETKMGGDFSDVQVHTGPEAAAAADSINARAFTVGNHVAFNDGEYDPGSESGKKILAHELTHVRQQTDGRVSLLSRSEEGTNDCVDTRFQVQPTLELSSPDDPAEKEAEEVADQVNRMSPTVVESQQVQSKRQYLQRASKPVFRSLDEQDVEAIIEDVDADYWINDEDEMVTGDELRDALSEGREEALESGRAIPVKGGGFGKEEQTGYEPEDYEIDENAIWHAWRIGDMIAMSDRLLAASSSSIRTSAEEAIENQLVNMELSNLDYPLQGRSTVFAPYKIGSGQIHSSNEFEHYAESVIGDTWPEDMEVYSTPVQRWIAENEGEDIHAWYTLGETPELNHPIDNVSLARMGVVLGCTDLVGFAGDQSMEQNYDLREERAFHAREHVHSAYMNSNDPPAVSHNLGVIDSQGLPITEWIRPGNETPEDRAWNRSVLLYDFFVPIRPDPDEEETRDEPVDVSLIEKTMTHIRQFLGKEDGVTFEFPRHKDQTVSIDFNEVDDELGPYGNINESADLGNTISDHTDPNEQFYHSLHNLLENYMNSHSLYYWTADDVDSILCQCYDDDFDIREHTGSLVPNFETSDNIPEPRDIQDMALSEENLSLAYTEIDRIFGRSDSIAEVITGIEDVYKQAILGLRRVGRHSENMGVGRTLSPPSVLGHILELYADQRNNEFLGFAMEWFEASDVTLPGNPISLSTWPVDACQ